MNLKPIRVIAWLVGALLVMAAATSGFDFSELEEAVSEYQLDNGLKILVLERHDAPVASFVTLANVGAANDPKEYTGMAHMFEHMAFKGTTTLGTSDIKKELAAMKVEDSVWYELRAERQKGQFADSTRLAELETAFEETLETANEYVVAGEYDRLMEVQGAVNTNAGTGSDQTQYIMSLPSNKLELFMATESERFLNPVLREMYQERNVIAEERRQGLENNPINRTLWLLMSTAFEAHPYRIPIVGHMSDIQNYTRDAAKAYYKKYYVPSNMIVAIVGDVDPEEVFKQAKKYWGRIPASPRPPELATVEPEQEGERRVELEDRAQPLFVAAWHVPQETHPDWPAVEALADYLGQGRTSLLYKNLVKEKKIAAQSGSFAGWPGNKYPCLMIVYAVSSPGHTNEEGEEQIFAEVEKLKAELIPADEVDKIKARAKANLINGLSSNLGLAIALAGYENQWGDWRQLFLQLDRINALTPEDLQRAAQKYLTKQNRTVAKLNTIEG
ncbi:MAG: insulinase family protein [Candidatus Zixiibacteriota bacterium]|nr:MAG: insulinase family protein [candidate division Zixibacteria bacterium]